MFIRRVKYKNNMQNPNKYTITREYLAKSIKKEVGVSSVDASDIVDEILDFMMRGISQGKEVKIRMFGSFSRKSKKERVGRNPKTKEEAKIEARDIVRFKIAPKLKKRINDNIHLIP